MAENINEFSFKEDKFRVTKCKKCIKQLESNYIAEDFLGSSNIGYSNFKYVVDNIELDKCNVENLFNFFHQNIKLIDEQIKMILCKKISILNDNDFKNVMYVNENQNITFPFFFFSFFNKNQKEKLLIRLYNTIENSNDKNIFDITYKKNFINDFKKFFSNYSIYIDSIANIIFNNIIKTYDYKQIIMNLQLLYHLLGNEKTLKFDKETIGNLNFRIENDFEFMYTILNPKLYGENNYAFINDNIINNVGEVNLLKVVDSSLIGKKNNYKNINKALILIENIVRNGIDEKNNCEIVKNIVSRIYKFQKQFSDEYKTIIFPRFINNLLFCYLDKDSQNDLIKFLFSKEHIKFDFENLALLIINQKIDNKQFDILWNCLLNNVDYYIGKKRIFLLIQSIISFDGFNKLDDYKCNILKKYIENNKSGYLECVNLVDGKWSDIEIEYMINVQSVESIHYFLSKKHKFSDEKWKKVFNHFYNDNSLDKFELDEIMKDTQKYKEFHCYYISKSNSTKYVDLDYYNKIQVKYFYNS